MKSWTWVSLVAVAALGVTATVAMPAFGATHGADVDMGDIIPPVIAASVPLPTAVARVERALGDRSVRLAALSTRISSSSTLTSSDRSALATLVSDDAAGIDALLTKVRSEATVAGVRDDASAMVLQYHVFSFVSPIVADVIAIDAALASATHLSAQAVALQAALNTVWHSKHREVAAQRLLAGTTDGLDSTASDLMSLDASLLALDASSVPGSLTSISAAHAAIAKANAALHRDTVQLGRVVFLLAHPGPQLSRGHSAR